MNTSLTGFDTPQASPQSVAKDLIKDSDQSTFMEDVVEASKQVPVLVDFWAPWCGPCKQLGPTIEQAVTKANGRVKLVKINIDENQQIAQQMRVQSIPAVFAFSNGQPVDGFMGAKSAGEIDEFINKIAGAGDNAMGEQIAVLLEQATQALDAGDTAQAAQIFAAVIQADRENIPALTGLVKCHLQAQDLDSARSTFALIPPSSQDDPLVTSARAAIELAENPIDESELSQLFAKVAKNPDDFDARFALATALNAKGERETALEHLFHIIAKNRNWNDEAARKQVLVFFESWGPTDAATIEGRKKLSAILFS